MRIAVLGPGGVGGFVAAALARAGEDVVVVAREPTARSIAEQGIVVESVTLGAFTAHPRSVSRLTAFTDVLLVATKATGLEDALARVEAKPRVVVPLLNGLEHMALLRDRFGTDRVVAGVIRIDSDRPAVGRIVHTSPTVRVDLAAPIDDLKAALEHAGIPVRIGAGEAEILWSKLVRLNALACTTSASGRRIGFIRSDPSWRTTLEGCVRETAAVAGAEGAPLDPQETMAELDSAHPELGSSMQRDLDAGRPPELEAIPGAVLRAAARHGLECPTVAGLYIQIAERAGLPAETV